MDDSYFDKALHYYKAYSTPAEMRWILMRRKFYSLFPIYDTSETWFIHINNGIGDAVQQLGLLRAFQEEHKPKYTIIVIRKSLVFLLDFYPNISNNRMILEEDFQVDRGMANCFTPNTLIYPSKFMLHNSDWLNLCIANKVRMLDWFKYFFRLPMSASYEPPNFNSLNSGLPEDPLQIKNPDKSVILCPFPNFGPRLDVTEWGHIAQDLSNAGYDVYTNVANTTLQSKDKNHAHRSRHEKIPNTLELSCSLYDLLRWVKKTKRVVCGAGGLSLLLSYLDAKVLVVHKRELFPSKNINSSLPDGMVESREFIGNILKATPHQRSVMDVTYTPSNLQSVVRFLEA